MFGHIFWGYSLKFRPFFLVGTSNKSDPGMAIDHILINHIYNSGILYMASIYKSVINQDMDYIILVIVQKDA